MQDLKLLQPKLGNITAITITSPDLDKSLEFYQKLGFAEFLRADFPFPWIQVTDGALLLMLRKGDDPYISLTYYPTDIDSVVKALQDSGVPVKEMPTPSPMVKRYSMQSPDGVNITLVNYVEGFAQPAGPTMLGMQPQDYGNPEKYVNKVCGMFGEFAQPVKDLDIASAFYEKVGFTSISRFSSPYPWAILSDGLAIVGLHQTTNFSLPRITYFAKDMNEKIAILKEAGLTGIAETMGASNVTVTTPEQQQISLFGMGM